MTAREAIEKGIRDVRMPYWNEFSWLELPPRLKDGTHGPWANLYDPIGASVMQDHRESVGGQTFPIAVSFLDWDDNDNRLLEFTGQKYTTEEIRTRKHITDKESGVPVS